MTRSASGYSAVFWGMRIAKLAQGRVPKWCPRSSMPVGASRMKRGRPVGQIHPGDKAAAKASHMGAGSLSCIAPASLCRYLSDWLQNGVRQGMNSLPGLESAGGSISGGGARCQQQELLVFRGPWRDSDSQKPQAKHLNRNLRSKQHFGHCGSLRGWDKLSYKQSICQAATQ